MALGAPSKSEGLGHREFILTYKSFEPIGPACMPPRARPERVSCRDPGGTVNYQFDFAAVLEQWPLLLDGAWVTIKLSFCATVLGFVLGTLCALARLSRRPGCAGWRAPMSRRSATRRCWCRAIS